MIKQTTFFALLSCSLLLDIALLQQYQLFLSRFLFYWVIVSRGSIFQVALAGCAALLPTFILTGTVGLDLVVMVPLAITLNIIVRFAELNPLTKFLLVWGSSSLHSLFLRLLLS